MKELQKLIEGGAMLSQGIGIYGAVHLAAIDEGDGPVFVVSYKAAQMRSKTENRYRGSNFAMALATFNELVPVEVEGGAA